MPTLCETLGALEDELFVGRERELTLFENWLGAAPARPTILNVTGRGGIGKSTLLRAFGRLAVRRGRPVVAVDCRAISQTREGLLRALGSNAKDDVVAHLNGTRPLILLDTFEEIGDLEHFVHEDLLARLEPEVRVVIAGRHPLGRVWAQDSPWRRIVRPLPLEGFSAPETREYLSRRGLADSRIAGEITESAANSPLALALAADMAIQLGIRSFARAPERHLLVRTLVEQLLRDVDDPQLRELLEICAVVREFDESLLASVVGQDCIGAAFDRLCKLSIVRASEHGLRLHDDVRQAIAHDLRWRRPERHEDIRRRALDYYRAQARTARPDEWARLATERFFLFEDRFVQLLLFGPDSGSIRIEVGGPADLADCQRIWSFFLTNLSNIPRLLTNDPASFGTFDIDLDSELAYLAQVIESPSTQLLVARDQDGEAVGFSTILRVSRDSMPLLSRYPGFAPLINAYWSPVRPAAIPATADTSDVFFIGFFSHTDALPQETIGAITRLVFRLFTENGLYLSSLPLPHAKSFLESLGFERVPEARHEFWGAENPWDGYVLDLRRIGFEPWIEAILSGRKPPKALDPPALEEALQAALLHWTDDERLATSPLGQIPAVPPAPSEAERPAVIRQAILDAMARAKTSARDSDELAYRALELAYLGKRLSHERAAERLAVSRATFYRLLKRGITGVAGTLASP
ncbi:MAG: ATP-binding protein [Chloroflexi bacterium]|nr:ATP-binding protein [Chloroflexota bacterium]